MASCLCPCRRPEISELRLDAPVSRVAVVAVVRPRVRLAAVAASLDAPHAPLAVVVALAVRLAAPVFVVVFLVSQVAAAAVRPRVRPAVVAVSLDAPHAQLVVAMHAVAEPAPASAVPAQRDVRHVAPDRDLAAQQAVVVELEPALAPVARLCPDARLAP